MRKVSDESTTPFSQCLGVVRLGEGSDQAIRIPRLRREFSIFRIRVPCHVVWTDDLRKGSQTHPDIGDTIHDQPILGSTRSAIHEVRYCRQETTWEDPFTYKVDFLLVCVVKNMSVRLLSPSQRGTVAHILRFDGGREFANSHFSNRASGIVIA